MLEANIKILGMKSDCTNFRWLLVDPCMYVGCDNLRTYVQEVR
jgi:hypothetical protein